MSPDIRAAGVDLARRSRAAQGLPMRVTDPVVLAKLAAIVANRDVKREAA